MLVGGQSLQLVALQPNVLIHKSDCCTIEVQTDDDGKIIRIHLYETEEPEDNASSETQCSFGVEYGSLLSSSGTGFASLKLWIGGLSVNDDRADSGRKPQDF